MKESFQSLGKDMNIGIRRLIYLNAAALDHVISPVVKELKSRHGIETAMLTSKALLPRSAPFFDRDVFSEIIDVRPLLELRRPDQLPPAGELARRARLVETEFGVSLLDSIRSDRHLGIGFVTGARFMRSRYGHSATYAQSLDLVLRIADFSKELLARLEPIAILGYPGTIFSTCLISLAEAKGIPMRMLWASRRGKSFAWATDRWGWPKGFQAAFEREMKLAQCDSEGVTRAENLGTPARAKLYIDGLRKRASFRALFRDYYKTVRNNWRRVLFPFSRTTYGEYAFFHRFAFATERWLWLRRTIAETPKLATLPEGAPAIFFPLHMEPEASLMVEAADADNQLTCIDWLAKAVPAGWYVLIKEHPAAAAPRPKGFWDQLRRYPNVIVLATLERSEDAVDRSMAVAVINSTVGIQAAALGKPVLSFHKHYNGVVLPHVLLAESFAGTKLALRRIEANDLPSMAERLNAVAAFFRVADQFEFSLDDDALISGKPGRTRAKPEVVEMFLATFLATLDTESNTVDRVA